MSGITQITEASDDELKAKIEAATKRRLAELIDEELLKARARDEVQRIRAAENAPTVEILDEQKFDALPAANWLVDQVFLQACLATLVGEPGTGKTFLALDLALSISAGLKAWLGRKLNASGPVVYVVAEGQGRFKYRKAVWKQERGINRELPFHIVRSPVDLRNEFVMANFIEQVQELGPAFIVFDTLHRNMPGAEENSSKEFGQALAMCSALQQATGATVLLLHHPTKDGKTSRGSGSILGAVDTEAWLRHGADRDLFVLDLGKQKDGDDTLVINLRRRVVELSGEADPFTGEPITSCLYDVAAPDDVIKATASIDYRVLEFLYRNPGTLKSELAKQMKVQRNAVTATLNTLIQSGDVIATKSGRTQALTVSASGEARIQAGPPHQGGIPF